MYTKKEIGKLILNTFFLTESRGKENRFISLAFVLKKGRRKKKVRLNLIELAKLSYCSSLSSNF